MESINLNSFISEGCIIRTKHCDSRNWITNVVYGINNEFIEIDIGLEKKYVDNLIMVGDNMKCKFTTDNIEYTLAGWVTKIKAEFPQSLTIRVQQVEQFDNKRDSYRFDVYMSSVIKKNKRENKGIFAIMTNISKTGAAFVVHDEVERVLGIEEDVEESISAFFDVYVSPSKILNFEGTLLRKGGRDKGIEYGVRILDMEIESEKILNGLIIDLEKKDEEFYNKRSGFWSKKDK